MYNENGTKIMVYNIKRCPKIRGLKNGEKESLRNTTPKGKTPDTDYTILARPRTIFIPYSYKYSSIPFMIVTSFLNSS